MAKFTNPLANVRVASPCPANWDEMLGDSRKRFCGQCKLNVYNLSGMTRTEAENLLVNAEGRLCVRFYRRADGTVLTRDCPVGWRALKRKISRTATAAFSFVVGLFGGLGFGAAFNSEQQTAMGEMALPVVPITREISDERVILRDVAVIEESEPTIGKMIIEPKPIMGKIAIPQKNSSKPKR